MMRKNFAGFVVLATSLISSFLYPSESFGKHYNSVKLSCEISGSEVSLTPVNQPGPRIQKISYPEKVNYVLSNVVYISDSPLKLLSPMSFNFSFNEDEFPNYWDEDTEHLPTVFEQFHSPQVRVQPSHAQTTVSFELSRDQLLELLTAMGSPTADTFHSASDLGFASVAFSRARYFPKPHLFKTIKPAWSTQRNGDLPIEFTGWFGRSDLETCYQLDPVNFDAPEDLYYNGLAYHICGTCKVEPLESSSPAFAPVQNTVE